MNLWDYLQNDVNDKYCTTLPSINYITYLTLWIQTWLPASARPYISLIPKVHYFSHDLTHKQRRFEPSRSCISPQNQQPLVIWFAFLNPSRWTIQADWASLRSTSAVMVSPGPVGVWTKWSGAFRAGRSLRPRTRLSRGWSKRWAPTSSSGWWRPRGRPSSACTS